jgi:hypothetical protein
MTTSNISRVQVCRGDRCKSVVRYYHAFGPSMRWNGRELVVEIYTGKVVESHRQVKFEFFDEPFYFRLVRLDLPEGASGRSEMNQRMQEPGFSNACAQRMVSPPSQR